MAGCLNGNRAVGMFAFEGQLFPEPDFSETVINPTKKTGV